MFRNFGGGGGKYHVQQEQILRKEEITMNSTRQILKNCFLFLRQRLFKGALVKYLSIIFVQLFFLSCSVTEMTRKNQIDDGIAKAKTLGENYKIIDSKQGRFLASVNTSNERHYDPTKEGFYT